MNEETKQPAASNIVGGPMAPAPDSPVEVVDVQFHTGAKVYYFDPDHITVATGDHIIIETARGPEYGICAGGNHTVAFKDIVPPLRKVLRIATEEDRKTLEANRSREKRAFDICQQKILDHKLDMQLVSAEYAFDGSKILFFFTADDRVDFRELVKNLASIFRTRIELRQIGVRDKAKMVGGLGICGRPFCCTEFLEDFQPVSIKMAKTQNLSLNPTKISGTCGRLMCCLKYEQDAYEDLLKTSPKLESFVDTPSGRGTVVDVNLLRQSVRVRMEEQPDTIETYRNEEIAVLRSGKAKKNDPPIPADLAPISGKGKRPHPAPEVETEAPIRLDPIRFRYRPDDIVEETPEEESQEIPETVPEIPVTLPAPAVEHEKRQTGSRRKKESRPVPAAEAAPEAEDLPGESTEKEPQANRRKPRNDRRPKAPRQDASKSDAEGAVKPEKAEKPAGPEKKEDDGAAKVERKPRPQRPRKPRPVEDGKVPQQQEASEQSGSEKAPKPHRNNYHRRRYHKGPKPESKGE